MGGRVLKSNPHVYLLLPLIMTYSNHQLCMGLIFVVFGVHDVNLSFYTGFDPKNCLLEVKRGISLVDEVSLSIRQEHVQFN